MNNSVLRPMGDWTSPPADFAKSMAVNATGLFMMTRAFGEHMAGAGAGASSTWDRSRGWWGRITRCMRG